MINQNPEQIARDNIDRQLEKCGWKIQDKKSINLGVSLGVVVREYYTNSGPADYIMFVDKRPVGVIEAKREDEGVRLVTAAEDQSVKYAYSKLKYLENDPLPFVYESTGEVTRFTDYRDTKPRSRENLGEQAEQEFLSYLPNDDNRKFSELYGVHRLRSSYLPPDNKVYISTIQRFYSILKGEELDEDKEYSAKQLDDLKKVTPTAKYTKDHFVIVDAIGVTKSLKTDSRPLEKKPGVPLKDLLGAISVGDNYQEIIEELNEVLAA